MTNTRFKYALRYIKNNEYYVRRDALATKLQSNNVEGFWKEVKLTDNCNTRLPTNIEGVVGCEKIAEKNNYKELFNCVRSNINNVKFNVEFCNDMAVGAKEIRDVIKKLYYYKTCGIDNIYAEHFKYASSRVFSMLGMCLTGFLIHRTQGFFYPWYQ